MNILPFLTPKEFAQKEEDVLLKNSNLKWHYCWGESKESIRMDAPCAVK